MTQEKVYPHMRPTDMCWECSGKYNYRDYQCNNQNIETCKICGRKVRYYTRYNKAGEKVPYFSCGVLFHPFKPETYERNPYKCYQHCRACGIDLSQGDPTKPKQFTIEEIEKEVQKEG